MAIVARNVYVGGVKVNDVPIPLGTKFTIPGLASDSDYPVTATSIDAAGNEGPQSLVFPLSTPAYETPAGDRPLSDADKAAVDAIVAASMAESKQPGVIISITGPRGHYSRAYGKSAITNGRPLTVDDHFRIGSVSKTFTATAVFQQIDAGNLALTDTLDKFVDGVPAGDKITIRHMLMMRSGVVNDQSNSQLKTQLLTRPSAPWPRDNTLKYIRSQPSQFEPGTKYLYTNSNYILLGLVLEAVTGRAIRDIITEDVIAPCGLTETSWPTTAAMPEPYTHGFGANPLKLIPIIGWFVPAVSDQTSVNPDIYGAAGALISTVGDLIKWAQAMRDGTLISPASLAAWHDLSNFVGYASGFDDPPPAEFGYGCGQESTGTWFGHNGSIPGFSTQAAFDSVSGACIAVSENYQTTTPVVLAAYSRIFRKIAAYLYPDSMVQPDYSGVGRLTVRPAAASLILAGGTPAITIEPIGMIIPAPAALAIVGGRPLVMAPAMPAAASLAVIGGTPTISVVPTGAAIPSPASMAITGGQPTVTIEQSFTPFSEENLSRIDRPVPVGTQGCWVTLIGAGAHGTNGENGNTGVRSGGNGGGGGARIGRFFVPVSYLGPTYSVTAGAPGGYQSSFSSGSVNLVADGGTGAAGGAVLNQDGVTGLTTLAANGSPQNTSNTQGAGGGGGHGGSIGTNDLPIGGTRVGASSATGGTPTGLNGGGGAGGAASSNSVPGNGAPGSDYGGGGGGGGARGNTFAAGQRGAGAPGYSLVEWV